MHTTEDHTHSTANLKSDSSMRPETRQLASLDNAMVPKTAGTVLVVDDNSINLKVLYQTLTNNDYRVIPAQDGNSALLRLELIVPDLILLDVMMPGMNGFELYAHIRQNPQFTDIPVIFISALSDTETIERGFALGAVDYITKPFRAVEILGRVGAHIRLKTLKDSLTATNMELQTVLNRHQCILNRAGEGIFGVDAKGQLIFINPYALEQLGYADTDVENLNIHNAIHHTDAKGQDHELDHCSILKIARDGNSRIEKIDRFYRSDNSEFPVEFTAAGITNADNSTMAVVLFRDITKRLQIERQLKEAAAVFEVSSEGIFLTDTTGIILRINPAFSVVTGYTAADVLGKTPRIFKSGRHSNEFYADMWEKFTTCGHWEGEIWNRRQDGSLYPEWEMITAIRGNNNEILGYVAQFSDITRRKLTEDELRYRGNYDILTGLANRALLVERLDQAIKEHRRRQLKLAVLFIDLDRFKQVNDSLGHHVGDMLLQQVATRISNSLREIDTAARLGGDEFIILLTDLEDRDPVQQIANRLIETLGQPFQLEEHRVNVGASIGVTIFPDDGECVTSLLKNADLAMYLAKDGGRGQARFFTSKLETHKLCKLDKDPVP